MSGSLTPQLSPSPGVVSQAAAVTGLEESALSACLWPRDRAHDALFLLARHGGLSPNDTPLPAPEPQVVSGDLVRLGHWIEWAAGRLELEAEAVEETFPRLELLLKRAAPAVVALPDSGLLLLLGCRRGILQVLRPDLGRGHLPLALVRDRLAGAMAGPILTETDELLEAARVPEKRRPKARDAILMQRLGKARAGGCWLLRPVAGGSFWQHLRFARVPQRLWRLLGLNVLSAFLEALGWWLLGRAALSGHYDPGWMLAWALLLLTLVPLRASGSWLAGKTFQDAGALLKQRLLVGALRQDSERVRTQGVGQTLGLVIESEALESLAFSGGVGIVLALVDVISALVVLSLGAGAAVQLPLFLLLAAANILAMLRYYRVRRAWTLSRLTLTLDLVERMVGHRTRLVQEAPSRWHEGEDQLLSGYLGHSLGLDQLSARLSVLLPRGWLLFSVLGLAPVLLAGGGRPATLAVALGGVLLGQRALSGLAGSLGALARAAISWEQVAPLFKAAGSEGEELAPVFSAHVSQTEVPSEEASRPDVSEPGASTPAEARSEGALEPRGAVLLEGRALGFGYAQRGRAVLTGVQLQVRRGEQLLLEGASGGGKSTLAALLSGLRQPSSGLLLLGGLDRGTLGARSWRRRVATAPQFHENHVLANTFAFNLLMGRGWPPRSEDLAEAQALCEELGLGPLLEKMPSGLNQQLGETGWQLSHGERSRLYLARALLQDAELVILDESFAALDPETLELCLGCARRRAKTLMVIAHP